MAELTPLSRSPIEVNSRPRGGEESAAQRQRALDAASTPDTIALAALVNTLHDTPDSQQQAVLDAAVGNGLFGTIFSMEDGAQDPGAEGNLADEIFSMADVLSPEEQGADNIVSDGLPRAREGYNEVQGDIAAGTPAEATTPSRETYQALRRKDWAGAWRGITHTGNWLNQKLHDHLLPMKRWIAALPIPASMRASLEGAMYRAPGVRDSRLNEAMENHGGAKLNTLLAAFSTRYNITVETAIRDAGYWITAMRAATGNSFLIQNDTDAVKEAQAALAAGTGTQAQVNAAVAKLTKRITAVNNPATKVKEHVIGVAGMNNAQARRLIADIEARYSPADLEAIAEQVYNLNAWRLTHDVENGKSSPSMVVKFLRKPQLLGLLRELRALGETTTAEDPVALATLKAKREEVAAAVRSNYVPLTGDPNTALTEDLFYHGSQQPNTARDYRMEGRTNSIPDNGISTTFAGVLKSASYAGWRDFQDGIAQAYNAMDEEQRKAAGIFVRVVGRGESVPAGAIVRRRGGRSIAYVLRDAKLLEAVRSSNFEDTSNLLTASLGKVTRLYSYAATQLAPWFAPKNFIRDFWDRSEILRTREYLDASGQPVDSTKIARGMLAYMFNPAKFARLLSTTGRHGYGMKPNNTPEARYLEELMQQGGASIFGDRFVSTRTDMVKAIMAEKNGSKQLAMFGRWIKKYNRTFDMGPSLAAYMALRDAGVPIDRAASGVLDLMNFRKRGENSATIGALYAFAQPSITSGVNTLASLRTKRGMLRLAGYTVALMGIQALLRNLADDDEGGNRLDQQSDFLKNTHILVPFGNGIIKIPLAFGITRIANGMARAVIGVGTGEMSPVEAAGDTISGSIVPVISPIEDTNISWRDRPIPAFFTTFAPTWLKPMLSVGFNLTPWGTPIVRDNYEKTDQYRSEQFGRSVAPEWKKVATFLRTTLGVDMAPEAVKTIMHGYPLGPGTMAINGLIENPYKKSKGYAVDNPLWQQVYAGYSESSIYFQFQRALTDTDDLKKEFNVGNKEFDAKQRKMLAWRNSWDDVDKELHTQKAKITRDKTLTEAAKAQRVKALQTKREQATTLALYRYRIETGQPATQVKAYKP